MFLTIRKCAEYEVIIRWKVEITLRTSSWVQASGYLHYSLFEMYHLVKTQQASLNYALTPVHACVNPEGFQLTFSKKSKTFPIEIPELLEISKARQR